MRFRGLVRSIGVAVAIVLAACDAAGISRDEAIAIAGPAVGSSTTPIVLVSAVRKPDNSALEREPENEARAGYVWVITFTGTWTGEGVAPNPPPEYHTAIVTVDAESGELVAYTGTN